MFWSIFARSSVGSGICIFRMATFSIIGCYTSIGMVSWYGGRVGVLRIFFY